MAQNVYVFADMNIAKSANTTIHEVINHLETAIGELQEIGAGHGEPVSPQLPDLLAEDVPGDEDDLSERMSRLEKVVNAMATTVANTIGAGLGVPEVVEPKKKRQKAKKNGVSSEGPRTGQGQSGPPLELPWKALNPKERDVLRALNGTGRGPRRKMTLEELAEECFAKDASTPEQANSWVRNSMRRLVRGSWVDKVEPGVYRISTKQRPKVKLRRGQAGAKAAARARKKKATIAPQQQVSQESVQPEASA